ncbi:MAG TPA: response regulator transcription factor [Actinomycetota bacterium]|nr:response regulator transcription factor [Actinomycetota bacterium]
MTSVLVVYPHDDGARPNLLGLREHGITASVARSAEEAMGRAAEVRPDLMVVELERADSAGIDLIREVRRWSDLPLIIVSSVGDLATKVEALEAGADDYLTKPAEDEELVARIEAVLRRSVSGSTRHGLLTFGDLSVDLRRRLATMAGVPIHLSDTEYRLLAMFVCHPGTLLSHDELLRAMSGGVGAEASTLRVYVRRLRRALGEGPSGTHHIANEPGLGYRWLTEPDSP